MKEIIKLIRLVTTEGLIAIGLVVTLILSLFYGSDELSTNIASGLVGYLGRGAVMGAGGGDCPNRTNFDQQAQDEGRKQAAMNDFQKGDRRE